MTGKSNLGASGITRSGISAQGHNWRSPTGEKRVSTTNFLRVAKPHLTTIYILLVCGYGAICLRRKEQYQAIFARRFLDSYLKQGHLYTPHYIAFISATFRALDFSIELQSRHN